ncbi:Sodium-dependent nutrient amino acid transporter 1 [Lucilia cuprina]|nr:Sodium-dependent nutrient amino acid transporter 1 [Lucilia cuprina]
MTLDAMIVTSLDTVTTHNLNVTNIKEVVKSGTALAFISYPDAIAKFQAIPAIVFAVLFFFMLFVLGVGSIVLFKGGQWILNLVDFYGGTYVIFALAIFEIVGVIWIYGFTKFLFDDVEFMTHRKVFHVLAYLLVVFDSRYDDNYIYIFQPLTYKGYWIMPDSANAAGWIIFIIGILQFPLWGLWYIKSFCSFLKSHRNWGPSNPETRAKWYAYKTSLAKSV